MKELKKVINPFQTHAPFLHPLKTLEKETIRQKLFNWFKTDVMGISRTPAKKK